MVEKLMLTVKNDYLSDFLVSLALYGNTGLLVTDGVCRP
jgi:hypothetical protein